MNNPFNIQNAFYVNYFQYRRRAALLTLHCYLIIAMKLRFSK